MFKKIDDTPKQSLHNSAPPNQFHRSRIMLEKLVKIVNPPTNQHPTLIVVVAIAVGVVVVVVTVVVA
jgi:hypothetical protein